MSTDAKRRPRRSRAALAVATILVSSALGAAASVSPAGAVGGGDEYYPVTPTRVVDTRLALRIPATMTAGQTATVTLAGVSPVPALPNVTAVALNLTVTHPTTTGRVTVFPGDISTPPNVSNVNFAAGQTIANMVIVNLDPGAGTIKFFNAAGSADVIADVLGYFGPHAAGGNVFHAYDPFRLADTREQNAASSSFVGGYPIGPGIDGLLGLFFCQSTPPNAVLMNVTATNADSSGYLTVYPIDQSNPPYTSNLNFVPGRSVPNMVIGPTGDFVPPPDKACSAGQTATGFWFFNSRGSVDMVADFFGWYDGDTSISANTFRYNGLAPYRALDTRTGVGGFSGKLGQAGTITLDVADDLAGHVPSDAKAVVMNVTATEPTAKSWLTVWPSTADSIPGVSSLNFGPGQTVPNLVTVKLGTDGKVKLTNAFGSTHVIADVVGYYAA